MAVVSMTLFIIKRVLEETPALFCIFKFRIFWTRLTNFKTWYSRLCENLKYTFLKMYRKRIGVIICQKNIILVKETENGMVRGLQNRHVQLIAIAGTIGTGLFLGAGRSLSLTGPSIILVIC